ncbi:MAG TPA: MFS transporter, partial [Bacillota bacterium]
MPYYRRNLIVLSITIFMAATSWNQILPFLPLFLKELGVKSGIAFWSGMLLSVQAITVAFSGPFWGKMADKYSRKLMTIRAGFCLALIYFGMSLCQSLWQLVLLRFLNGLLTGFIPGSLALIATNTPKDEAGRYLSIAQTANAIGGIAGPVVGGILAGVFGYRFSMAISGVAILIAMLLVLFLVEERYRAEITQKTSIWRDYQLAIQMPTLQTVILAEVAGAVMTGAVLPIIPLYLEQIAQGSVTTISGIIFSLPGIAFVLTAYAWNRRGEKTTYPGVILAGLGGACLMMLLQGFL